MEFVSFLRIRKHFWQTNPKSNIYKSNIFISCRFLFFLWIGAQLISDIVNSSALFDALKGIGSPILIYSTLIFLIEVYEKNRFDPMFLKYYFLGHSTGFIFRNILLYLIREQSIYYFFKWNFFIYLTMLLFILFTNKKIKFLYLSPILFSILTLQFRSNLLVFIIFFFSKLDIFRKRIKRSVKDLNIFKVTIGGVLNFFMYLITSLVLF